MQTSYTTDNAQALPGMIADSNTPQDIQVFFAAEAMPAGVLVTLVPGTNTVELPKSTSSTVNPLAGVTVFQESDVPGGYAVGAPVPVMRKGKIWTNYHGTAPANLIAPNLMHASDNTGSELAFRGFVTATATSTSAGVEITALAGGVVARNDAAQLDATDGLIVLELNLPA